MLHRIAAPTSPTTIYCAGETFGYRKDWTKMGILPVSAR
jgi:hypothetical protein